MVIDGGSGGGPGRAGDSPRRGRSGRAPRIEQPQTVIRLPKDPYDGEFKAPRARRGRGVLALAGIVVVVAAVIAINSSKHNNGAASQGATTGVGGGVPPATATVGQSSAAGGTSSPAFPAQTGTGNVLTGYSDTQNGAESAAANYVAAYGSEAMMTAGSRHQLVHQIADPSIETNLQQQLDQAFALAAQGFGLDKDGNAPTGQNFVSRAVPFGTSLANYSGAKATVAVWTNMIAGTAGQGSTHPVSETWSTVTLNLTWVNGDWKWSSFTQADGPTPVPAGQTVSSPSDLQNAVKQFARLRYAP